MPTGASNFEAIVGSPLLEQAEVIITADGILVRKNEEQNFVMQINLVEDENTLDLDHIKEPEIKREVEEVVKNYKPEKTETTGVEMKIVLINEDPIYERPRRLPLPEKQEVEKQVNEWLENDIVRPSASDFASPVVLVRKKDGSYRICVDYRKLSKKMMKKKTKNEKLKIALMNKPVLNIYRQDARTELHVDASKQGFGSALLQEAEDGKLHPVYFMSRKTSPAQEKLHSYELEVLAIIESLKKFRIYLLGIKFKVVTDCEAFKKTMDKKDLVTRVARWALLLEEFSYEIEHRKGERMRHVDALSRYPVVLTIENVILRKVQACQQQDTGLKAIMKILEHEAYEDYLLENGILYKEKDGDKLLVIPKGLQTEIIRTAHEPGHFAIKKTESLINKNYFIPKLQKKIDGVCSMHFRK